MLKMYKKECRKYDEIRLINTESGEFTSYLINKEFGFPFSYNKTEVSKMGYKSVNDCMKQLKQRGYLGNEIDIKEQRQDEKIGWLKVGVTRIERAGRICTTDFEDVCEKLSAYGVGFVDAQNQITAAYLNKEVTQ